MGLCASNPKSLEERQSICDPSLADNPSCLAHRRDPGRGASPLAGDVLGGGRNCTFSSDHAAVTFFSGDLGDKIHFLITSSTKRKNTPKTNAYAYVFIMFFFKPLIFIAGHFPELIRRAPGAS